MDMARRRVAEQERFVAVWRGTIRRLTQEGQPTELGEKVLQLMEVSAWTVTDPRRDHLAQGQSGLRQSSDTPRRRGSASQPAQHTFRLASHVPALLQDMLKRMERRGVSRDDGIEICVLDASRLQPNHLA